MSPLRSLPLLLAMTPLAACGLDRPIEPQPLVSVLDEWRQQVLENNAVVEFEGEPLQVENSVIGGDFGRLQASWGGELQAEATGSQSDDMIIVQMLAGGSAGTRWGMAIVGLYREPGDSVLPGTRARIAASNSTLIGCSGRSLFDWDFDTSAEITSVDVQVDANDPNIEHYTFTGEFEDGTELGGSFDINRAQGSQTAPASE